MGHCASVSVETPVCPVVQLWVEELSIDAFKKFSFLATIFGGGKYRFGVSHHEYLRVYHHGPPDLLRHVTGFPGLGLLPGLRRRGARAR